MKTKSLIPILAALPWWAIVSCAPSNSNNTHVGPPLTVSASDNSAGAAFFNQINAYRAKNGKKPFVRNPGLDHLAQRHSEFLRRNRGHFKLEGHNISHDGFEGRTAIALQKYQIPSLEENVAAGPKGTSMIDVFTNSTAHRKAILSNSSDTGIGIVVDGDGMIFVTELFGSPAASTLVLQQRFGMF